jgi:hypothetical protein
MAQDGTAILFTTRADNGEGGEDTIEDVEFINNIVRGSAGGINIYGPEGRGGHRLTIRNNLFADIDGAKWNGSGHFIKSTAWDQLTIENNTVFNSGNIVFAYGEPVRGFVFRHNIVFENEYGIKGDGLNPGSPTIERYFPGGDVSFNAFIGGSAANYRGQNLFPPSVGQIGFLNAEGGDYQLRPDSAMRGKGLGGKTIGADLNPQTVGLLQGEK